MLKILFVNNYYPPCDYGGGYMQLCEEVANGLAERGHDTTILTSTYRHGDEVKRPYQVHRSLVIDPDWRVGRSVMWQFFVGRRKREQKAISDFYRIVRSTKPDLIFVWHPVGLSRRMLNIAENLRDSATVYYFADYWLELPDEYQVFWQSPAKHWVAKFLKPMLSRIAIKMLKQEDKPIDLRCERAICVSDYVRRRLVDQGLISDNAVTIHNGVDTDEFSCPSRENPLSGHLKCLIAGRIIPEKGIHTVIEALHLLKKASALGNLCLGIIGKGDPDYIRELEAKVADYGLDQVVEFLPPVARDHMPSLLAQSDVFVASSEYAEPLARTVQEAMSCGLVVLGTTTGGTEEILLNETNGLTFSAGSADDLAQKFQRLLQMSVEERKLMAENGRKTVVERFSIAQTVTQIEVYLEWVVANEERR